ncbi:TPA: hypothetical protein LUJ97_000414 [Acinetobacter nosocomialis]|nr:MULTISPECIES: hypothetical protein [unclassified Acinetobacter]HBM1864844.1 hypothetical protein [Acinetobacter nosocomialis]
MDISTIEKRNKFIESLSEGLWIEWVLLTTDITAFYAKTPPQLDADENTFFILSLLKTDEKDLTIDIFREVFKKHIEQGKGKLRKLRPFPENYSPQNKCLTKSEDAELSFYFAVKACMCEFKNDTNKRLFGLSRAILLHGYALGLSGIESLTVSPIYYEDKVSNVLGGKAIADKSKLAEIQLFKLWSERFNNPNLTNREKSFQASFGRYIVKNPEIIKNENGEMLTKNGIDPWYTDPNSVSKAITKYEKLLKKEKHNMQNIVNGVEKKLSLPPVVEVLLLKYKK